MLALQLIAEIADDSDRGFMVELFDKNRYLMFYIAKRYTENYADAEDAVSESCIALIKKLPLIRGMDEKILQAYIVTTVKNHSLTIIQRRKKYVELDKAGDVESVLPPPDEQLMRECSIEAVKKAIEKLDETDRTILNMRYFLKCSDEEISETTGIKPSSVRARLTRARSKLYFLLKEVI